MVGHTHHRSQAQPALAARRYGSCREHITPISIQRDRQADRQKGAHTNSHLKNVERFSHVTTSKRHDSWQAVLGHANTTAIAENNNSSSSSSNNDITEQALKPSQEERVSKQEVQVYSDVNDYRISLIISLTFLHEKCTCEKWGATYKRDVAYFRDFCKIDSQTCICIHTSSI